MKCFTNKISGISISLLLSLILTSSGQTKESTISTDILVSDPVVTLQEIPATNLHKTLILQGKGLFPQGTYLLGANSEQLLVEMIGNLEQIKNIHSIQVVGHTDSKGGENANMRISLMRAKTVQAFLQGAYPDISIVAEGAGESNPAYPNTTPRGRELNRRVEIKVFKSK